MIIDTAAMYANEDIVGAGGHTKLAATSTLTATGIGMLTIKGAQTIARCVANRLDDLVTDAALGSSEEVISLGTRYRALVTYISKQADDSRGSIRLASCQTGACDAGFAQNLSNKIGVPVIAPTDTLFVFPNGKVVIGPNQFTNSGQWRTFYPTKPN